jgi:hypothetical protein
MRIYKYSNKYHYGSAKCLLCNRVIGLNTHGAFRRHTISVGVVCHGSWEWPHEQKAREDSYNQAKIKSGNAK